jgi:hypothetical protein
MACICHEAPQSPGAVRPHGVPYYISATCQCGALLYCPEPYWADEWACSAGCDGIYLDVDESFFEMIGATGVCDGK